MVMTAHKYEIVRRIPLRGGEARLPSRSVIGGRVNVANLRDYSCIRIERFGRNDGIGAFGVRALVSRHSKKNLDCIL
jgi:hypothetical protein